MKIVFSGGGTAGHIMPNIALINQLPKETHYYIGTDGMEKQLTKNLVSDGTISQYCCISASKFRRKISFGNLLLPFRLAKSVRQAKAHLKRISPDVVFSKGGYVGLPVIIAAKSLKIPTIIHESDMTVGLSNRISALFATDFLAAYPCHKKAKVVGALIRKNILQGNRTRGLDTMGFDGKKPTLLVLGGSLGAKALNDAVCATPALADKFDIFVICGKGKSTNCSFVHQAEFVTNINDIYAATDICLTRAGSNTLAELTLAGIPFVAVPLTKCSRGEQVKNAKWFEKHGCGLCISEENLSQKLVNALQTVWNNRDAITHKQQKQQNLFGTDAVLQEILKYSPTNHKKNNQSINQQYKYSKRSEL